MLIQKKESLMIKVKVHKYHASTFQLLRMQHILTIPAHTQLRRDHLILTQFKICF